ncbi:hypothetical protein Tco_1083170 [Tanacetum coccineum]|uniref:Uncharacterized protein n=1 Tax=Tanacetum coccineum TaxID=301880 RepID=A0ABQ5I2N4_9ASTR
MSIRISSIRKSHPPKGEKDGSDESIKGEKFLVSTNFEGHGLDIMSKGSICSPRTSIRHVTVLKIGKKNVPTFTKTSSAMPVGVEIVRSASSRIIRVLVKAGRLSSFQMERGIRIRQGWFRSYEAQRCTPIWSSVRTTVGWNVLRETPLSFMSDFTSPFGLAMFAWKRTTRARSRSGAGAGVWFFLSRINALTISFSSAISDETAGVEELVLTLETMALLRD